MFYHGTDDYDDASILLKWENKLLKWLLKAKLERVKNPLIVINGPTTHETAREMVKEIRKINPESLLVVLNEDQTLKSLDDKQLKRIGLQWINCQKKK